MIEMSLELNDYIKLISHVIFFQLVPNFAFFGTPLSVVSTRSFYLYFVYMPNKKKRTNRILFRKYNDSTCSECQIHVYPGVFFSSKWLTDFHFIGILIVHIFSGVANRSFANFCYFKFFKCFSLIQEIEIDERCGESGEADGRWSIM